MALRADVLVFAVGALLLGGGLYGLTTLPPDGGVAGAFTVTWAEAATTLTFDGVALTDGGRADPTLNVREGNLTRLVFVVSCTDRHPLAGQNGANLDVRVEGPAGQAEEASGACSGDLEVPVAIQAAPTTQTAAGTSEEDARNRLRETRTNLSSIGEWKLSLALSRPTTLPVGAVGGADLELSARAVRHDPTVTPIPR